MQDALILLVIFSVPLSAILSRAWLKAKTLDAEAGGQKLADKIQRLESDNNDLKRRMEVLESIVVDGRAADRLGQERREGINGARALEQAAQAEQSRQLEAVVRSEDVVVRR